MASTSGPNYTYTMKFDLFLSISGEDALNPFTDHLYHALNRARIFTFIDDDETNKGQELNPEVEVAIINSKASIILLSEKYANSRWCLDELCLILDQMRKCNHFVLPVYYHVDPSDVENQTGCFVVDESKGTVDDVSRWKAALTDVAKLSGMELSRSMSETDFIKEMVDTVKCELDFAHLNGLHIPNYLVPFTSSSTSHPHGPMASTSSYTPRPNHIGTTTYDVFLSFSGEDTRHAFTDHLYHALLRAGLRTFKHSDELDRGKELNPEIKTTIIKSRASIVVFSENYAKSKWCLDELWLILDQRRKCGNFVLPIFYHVNPSDVRNQRGSFTIDGSKWTVDDVKQWKAALTEVANLTGKVLSSPRSETNFIAEVVEAVSSSRPNCTYTSKYDIFLSFRGEDTRHTFTDHLYHALLRARLHAFIDNDAMKRGQELKPEIETAIMESRGSIVVLSKNYSNSRWCLDELCLILEQRRKCGHFVLPIFYDVEPSDVREQSRCLAADGSHWTVDDVRRWKAALTKVANLTAGVLLSGSETDFIAKVIDKINCHLDRKQVIIPEIISSWLKDEQSNTNVLAICGMGGSGKTTMAQYIYNTHNQHFEGSSFLEVSGRSHYNQDLLGLQKQLLSDISGGKKMKISSVSDGTHKIQEVLQTKKVLIVLDDIVDKDILRTLVGTKTFPTKTKIITTTRLLDIHAWYGSIFWRCWVLEIKNLNDLESLELLSMHAFGSKVPKEGFEELSVQLAQYCGGNPLALEVLGSSLFVDNENPRTLSNMIDVRRCVIDSLNSLKGHLDVKMHDVLQRSFLSLPFDTYKALFLDIACFFVGESKHLVTLLKEDLDAKSGITTLINNCLLTVSPYDELVMHPLLQKMGRLIVSNESKLLGKRSRFWHDDDSYQVLRKGIGSRKIESLALDMRKVEQRTRSESLVLKTSSFAKMDNLQMLKLKYVKLLGTYENFPDLRWLCWHGCSLKTMPNGLLMNSLVSIDMAYGCLEKFEAPKVLSSLKILNLKECDKLVSINNLHRLPKLETLILCNCSRLTHLSQSIGDLENLANLDLTGCTKLFKASLSKEYVKILSDGQYSLLSLPKSLMVLALGYCRLGYNNDDHLVFRARSLFELYLHSNPFDKLPSNIDLKNLRLLSLYSCPNLRSLPCMPSTVEELNIDWCESLEKITFQSGHFCLRTFDYRGCFKLTEVQGLFKLVPLSKLDEANPRHMKWIKSFQDQKVDLVEDEITKGRSWHVQMLYEYGIMSTYLQGIKDHIMPTYEYMSQFPILSFRVPSLKKRNRIQGLNLRALYRSPGKDKDMRYLLAKISNITKSLTWIYNPMVYCKPSVDENVVWLSYWPIGNELCAGDEIHVGIYVDHGMSVSGCGASLVYMDEEVYEEENSENNTIKEEEVIGGDLSEFEVRSGAYYLCRRDLFGLETSSWLNWWFDGNVDYPGWRKTRQSRMRTYNSGSSKHGIHGKYANRDPSMVPDDYPQVWEDSVGCRNKGHMIYDLATGTSNDPYYTLNTSEPSTSSNERSYAHPPNPEVSVLKEKLKAVEAQNAELLARERELGSEVERLRKEVALSRKDMR